MSNRRAFVKRLCMGIAQSSSERPKLLTLTGVPGEPPWLSRRLLGRRFAELRRRILRAFPGVVVEYAGSVELTRLGAVHLHVVLRGMPLVPQAVWSRLAARCGFGSILDIRQVRSADGMGRYLAKSLPAYLVKQAGEGFWPPHFRRVRFSRDWAEGWVPRGRRTRQPGAPVEWVFLGVLHGPEGIELVEVPPSPP